MDDILVEFQRNVSAPDDSVIRGLIDRGFEAENWLSFFPLPGVARVEPSEETFNFDPDGQLAMIFVEYHRGAPVDLLAWDFRNAVRSLTGWSHAMNGDAADFAMHTDLPIPVFRSVESLIKAGCEGIVITNLRLAKYRLSGARLIAENLEHGIQLEHDLLAPTCASKILVEAE